MTTATAIPASEPTTHQILTHDVPPAVGQQLELEEYAVQAGAERFFAKITKAQDYGQGSETPAGLQILRATVEPLSAAIAAWMEKALGGGRGRKNTAAVLLKGINTDSPLHDAH